VQRGAPARVPADRLADAAVGTYIDRNRMALDGVPGVYLRLAAAAATLRQPGSGGRTMAWVAAGRLAAIAMAAVPDWDWLPGELLIVEAGGRSVRHGAWRVAGSSGVVDEIAGLM
jgi:myo-inositol-1(or 4)-monophosphatase